MSSDSRMRMPYGPGWEDPDWTPHAAPPDESEAMKLESVADAPPMVSTLSQFMAIVRRVARPNIRRASVPSRAAEAAHAGQTRRWVMAGGAGLVALATLPGTRAGVKTPTEAPAQVALEESQPQDGTLPKQQDCDA